ncbi:MAG: c-type cytochrome [Gammaproteobacteria bacterium]
MADTTATLIPAALLALAFALPSTAAAPDEACADCHGKDGASTESDVPSIGGLSEQYLLDTLAAYKDKKRPCPETAYRAGDKKRPKTTMCSITAKLNDADVAAVAKDLAGEPFVKAKQPFDAAKAARGKQRHDLACEKCHSEGGTLADDDAGILAGQWTPYLRASFEEFRSGARPMPEKMKPKFEPLKPEELEALLHYYASFK